MNALMEAIGGHIKDWAGRFWGLSRTIRILVLVGVVALSILVLRSGTREEPPGTEDRSARKIVLARVSDLAANAVPLPLLGTVTSRSEATLRAETGGKIVAVYKKLGDYVSPGSVIAEFENSGERAAVLQAEGAYESAKLGKDIAGINSGTAGNSLAEAKTNALNAIASAYTGLDDAIRTKTDPAWRNPQTREAKLIVSVSDAKLVIDLEVERTAIETMLRAREERNKMLTAGSDLVAELGAVEIEANTVKRYLDDLSLAFNRSLPDAGATQSAIDGYKANTTLARTSVNGILSSITGSRNALNASIAGAAIAEKSGSMNSGESSADAALKSALGVLRGAQSRLEKTIVRSPIGGTINSLGISTGDFVSPYTEVAVVGNNGALEVLAYVTEDDAKELAIGGIVTIEGGGKGTVTRVAPALDPKTKKIEVRIGITAGTSILTNGASVRIEATRVTKKVSESDIKIPLAALKITPNGAVVFTVSEESTLVAHPVTMGALLGSEIAIPAGLTPDMEIVTDARGLQDGMVITK